MGRWLVEDGEGQILQLFLDLTNLSDKLDTVVADYCRCSLLGLGGGRSVVEYTGINSLLSGRF